MKRIAGTLWVLWFYILFGLCVILLFPLLYILLLTPRWHPLLYRIRKHGCRWVLWATGIRLKVEDPSQSLHLPQAIFVGNHTSLLDVIAGLAIPEHPVHFMGKSELARVPLVGVFFRYMDIPVVRGNRVGSRYAYIRAGQDLRFGKSLFIMPEGTTSIHAPRMLNFKKGAFKLAVEHGVAVVPVTFVNLWQLWHYDHHFEGKPGTARIVVHPPLVPGNGPEAIAQLMREAYIAIEKPLKDAYPDHENW